MTLNTEDYIKIEDLASEGKTVLFRSKSPFQGLKIIKKEPNAVMSIRHVM